MSNNRRTRTYKVIVQDSPICVEVAHYIRENIRSINRAGIRIRMQKLDADDDLIYSLRRRGITRLPVMVMPARGIVVGRDEIMTSLQRARSGDRAAAVIQPSASPGSIDEYWMREMYSGRDPKTGKLIPAPDDESEDVSAMLERQMREYQAKIPAHRREDGGVGDGDDRMTRPSGAQRRPGGMAAPSQHSAFSQMDNISHECEMCDSDPCECENMTSTGGMPPPTATGGDIDSMMMSAWIDNNYDPRER